MSGLGFFYCCCFSTGKKIFLSSFVIWRGEDELMWGQRPEIILENFFFLFYAANGIKQTNCSFRPCLWQKSTCSQWIITCFHPSHSHRVQAVFTPLKSTNSNKTANVHSVLLPLFISVLMLLFPPVLSWKGTTESWKENALYLLCKWRYFDGLGAVTGLYQFIFLLN